VDELLRLLRRQDGVVTRQQALDAGLTPSALRHRTRPGGPWQTPVPGVHVAVTGTLTERQRRRVALLHVGPGAQLGSWTAVRSWGLRAGPARTAVHVLAPHSRHVASRAGVVVERTTRLPVPVRVDGLDVSPLPRAVVDAARRLTSLVEVRALLAEPVQRGLVTVDQLADELAGGPVGGSRLARRVLAEVADGVRSATEAELRLLLRRSPLLRSARWDVRLVTSDGRWLADVDCYVAEAGLVVESDSRAWHLSPEHWERTMARHSRMTAAGLRVVHVSPRRHRTDGPRVLAEVEAAYRAGVAAGGCPGVRAVARRSAA